MKDEIDVILSAFLETHTLPDNVGWNDYRMRFEINKGYYKGEIADKVNHQWNQFRFAWNVCYQYYKFKM